MGDFPSFIKHPELKKAYAHFDYRCSFASVAHLVTDASFVTHYAFFPLIEKPLRRMKQGDDGKPYNKPRPIRYAAHLDRCIYQYYAGLLNNLYNIVAVQKGIDSSSLAYRTNKPGQSNVSFALRAFTRMRELGTCYVYAGDFKDFFETLDHRYLKRQVRSLFSDGHIPDDYYQVVKNAMRYSVWTMEELLDYHGFPHSKLGVRKLNSKARVLSPKEFKRLVKDSVEQPWKEKGQGIPQGLPISGILANIYMIEFDEAMARLADELGGMYMRYSDDFIFISPTEEGMHKAIAKVAALLSTVPSVVVHPEKTKAFCLRNGVVTQLMIGEGAVASHPSSHIDYLGFSFDGINVRLRQRTIGRYYRRMYHRVKRVFGEGVRPSNGRVEELYIDFSDWGSDPSRNKRVRRKLGKDSSHGNFLTYAYRAQEAFPGDPVTNDVKRHKLKIRRRAQKVLGEVIGLCDFCNE